MPELRVVIPNLRDGCEIYFGQVRKNPFGSILEVTGDSWTANITAVIQSRELF